jgi:tetratricopeptide (TPR) repeat protein
MNIRRQTHLTPRFRSCRGRVHVLVLCLLAAGLRLASPARAQSAPASSPAAGVPSAAATRLAGVAGVQAAMTSDQLIDLAAEAARGQRWADAERILTEVIREEPRNLKAYQLMARVYEVQAVGVRGNTSDPTSEKKADLLTESAVKTYLEYAAPLAKDLGNLDVAEQIYKTVLQLRPNNAQAELGMARVLGAMGGNMQMQAIDRYRSYLNPRNNAVGYQDPQAHLELGRIYRAKRALHQAVATLEKARGLDPENPEILLELAKAYEDTGDRPKAMELAKSAATEKAAGNAAYRNVYAQVLLSQSVPLLRSADSARAAQQNLEESRRQAAKAVELAVADVNANPGDAKPLATESDCYGTYEKILNAVLIADAGDVGARVDLAGVIQEHAAVAARLELHRALDAFEKAGPTARQNAAFLQKKAELQFEVGQAQAAGETCRELLKVDPANAAAKRILAATAAAGAGQPTGSRPASAPAKR